MTDASLPAGRFVGGDFRVGHVVSRAWSVLSRNFLSFFVVTAVAAMPQAATGTVGGSVRGPASGRPGRLAGCPPEPAEPSRRALRRVPGHARQAGRSGRID